jgi:hypothetical protein
MQTSEMGQVPCLQLLGVGRLDGVRGDDDLPGGRAVRAHDSEPAAHTGEREARVAERGGRARNARRALGGEKIAHEDVDLSDQTVLAHVLLVEHAQPDAGCTPQIPREAAAALIAQETGAQA